MAQVVGELEIRMFAELARLRSDMEKANSIVSKSSRNIEKSISFANRALGALGIGLSAGFFVNLIKGSIDAADHLKDLSKTTNLTVEELAGLRVAAKQSGSDLDGTAKAIAKLSENIGKDTEKFRLLGITAKEPLEAFKQLADVYVALEDPQQRAAVMAQALGRSWQSAAPLLAEGGERIGELVDRGSRLSGVTTDIANQADALNDKWTLLGGTGGMLTRMIAPILPLLNVLADDMLIAQERAMGMDKGFNILLEALKAVVVFGGNVSFVLKGVGTELGVIGAQLAAIGRGEFSGFMAIGEAAKEDARIAREEFDAWEKKIMSIGKESETTAKAIKEIPKAVTTAKKASASSGAEAFLADPNYFRKIMADIEKATATSQMNMVTDEREKSLMRIKIAEEEMLAKVNFEKLTTDQKKQYMEALALFSAAKTEEEMKRSQGAFMDLMDTWGNVTKQMQDATASWAGSAADELTKLVMTGKASFKDFANAVIADLVRIMIQKSLAGIVGSIFGGSSTGAITGRAVGGPVMEDQPYIVGERGPEMFVPNSSGRIVPQDQMGGVTVTNVFNVSTGVAETVRAEMMNIAPIIEERSKHGVLVAIERGGRYSRAVGRKA